MDERVRVKILPLHNIGGVGKAGDVVWMTPKDAEAYVRDGYVTPLSTPLSMSTSTSPQIAAEERGDLGGELAEDHAIMKPVVRRAKKVVRKK